MSPDDLAPMAGMPILTSTAVDPGEAFLVGAGTWATVKIVMHPLDRAEMGTQPGSMERVEKGIAYLLSEANRKLDLLEAHIAA